jgi:uncharacterized protein YkwD
MKRKKVLAIVLTLLILLFTVTPMGTAQFKVEASEAYQKVNSSSGTVIASGVNLRTGPATTFDIICKLNKDQKVTVIGKIGSWYAVYVSSTGNIGAISAQFLKFDKAKVINNTKKATTAKKATITTTKSTKSIPKVVTKTDTKAITATSKVKDISSEEQSLLDLINKARKEKDLSALEFDASLVKIARLKVNDMKDNNYFSHTSKFYGTPFDMMKKYEIKFSAAGENIAGNQTIEKAVKAWSDESGNNLFNKKFTHTGIGIVDSPTYGKLFVQMFIKKS